MVRILAGLGSGDGPLSVRGCPSTVKGHLKILSKPLRRKHLQDPPLERRSLCTPSGQKPRARPSLPGPGAGHPLHGAAPNDLKRRAINVQLARATSGQSRPLRVIPSCLASDVSGHDLSNSQADSAGPIPGERFSCKTIGHSNYHRGNSMSAQAASHNVLTVTRRLFRPEGTGGQNQKVPLPSSPGKPCQSPGMPSCSFPASSTART